MQFIDLHKQYETLQSEIDANLRRVLSRCSFILGPENSELEHALADFSGVKHALCVSSGTDALLLPLMAWNVGVGDAVFTTAFSFFATAEAIALLGATPVFCDIRPDTFNLDPASLRAAIGKTKAEGKVRPKAIIPVDLFGQCADYDEIIAIAAEYDLLILEDAAQGYGGVYRGKQAGSFGHAAATSFFPAKPLGCYGDGGAVFTNDDALAELLGSLRVHGQGKDKYENVRLGINGRLDTLQAAVLLPKLKAFPGEIKRRNEIAAHYTEALSPALIPPFVADGCVSTWAQYSLLAKDEAQRTFILKQLAKSGIPTAIYYSIPLHLQKAFALLDYRAGDLPVCEDCAKRIFSLPMHAYLTDEEVNFIASAVCSALEESEEYQ